MATAFANGLNPWTNALSMNPPPHKNRPSIVNPETPKTMQKHKPKVTGSRVDPEQISIASDPLPSARLVTNKYWPVFAALKVGQNIRCKPNEVQCISSALRKYIEVHKVTAKGKPTRVLTQSNAPDGIGRVWLVEGTPKSMLKAVL